MQCQSMHAIWFPAAKLVNPTSLYPNAHMHAQSLDLTNPATFRDFSLPMGAQNRQRLKRFIERYNLTKEDPTGT